jgi:tetratricopeptide (TPR) repeat protein
MILFILAVFFKSKTQIDQVNKLNNLLFIKKDPGSYVRTLERILERKQSQKNIMINVLQKTTGLFYMGNFDEVINILTNDLKNVPKNWEPIYYQNLILSLYFKGEKQKAEENLKKAKSMFEEFNKNNYYTEMIEIVYVVSDYFNGKKNKNYFSELSKNGANDYRKAMGHYFLGLIYKSENNKGEATAQFNLAAESGKGSFIEELSIKSS